MFSLLETLVLFIPRFCSPLLSEVDNGNGSGLVATTNASGGQATIISVLRNAIRTRFDPPRSVFAPPKKFGRGSAGGDGRERGRFGEGGIGIV